MTTQAQTCAIGILPNRRNAPKSTGPHSQKVLEIPSITLFLFALVALWLKNPFNQRNPRLKKYSSCRVLRPLHLSRTLYKSPLFMQNEPNFDKGQNKPNPLYKKDLRKFYTLSDNEKRTQNEPKTNPIKANLLDAQMNVTTYISKDYENVPLRRRGENKPNQTRSEFTPKGAEIPTGELLGILKPGTNLKTLPQNE